MQTAHLPPSVLWTLLFNILFGSIASRAFSEFYQSITADLDEDGDLARAGKPPVARHYLLRGFVFAAAFAFYVYDWVVLQILILEYPYSLKNGLSYARFANDLVMSFLLFGIVWSAARPRVLERPLRLIIPVSVWHVHAALWHLIAKAEFRQPLKPDATLAWHLVWVQLIYWMIFLALRPRAGVSESDAQRQNRLVMGLQGFCILGISLYRSFYILHRS